VRSNWLIKVQRLCRGAIPCALALVLLAYAAAAEPVDDEGAATAQTPPAGDGAQAEDPFDVEDPFEGDEDFTLEDPFSDDADEDAAAAEDPGAAEPKEALENEPTGAGTAADGGAAVEPDFDEDAAFEEDDPFVDEDPVADEEAAASLLEEADLGAFFGPSSTELLLEEEGWPKSDSEELLEGIAAQVGSGVVLVSEVRKLSAPVEERMRAAGVADGEIRNMQAEALDRLIESRLIEDVVRRAQLSATDAEVNQAIAAIANENGLTVEQMSASIASHGLTVEEYRAKIKSEIERNKVISSMVRSRVYVDEKDVEELYEARYAKQRESGMEIHLGHLLIATGAQHMRDETTACAIAEKLRGRIESGDISFATAAREYSDINAERGGDLGWVHGDELAGWMAPAVADLQPGQISQVVPMYFGCNLLRLVDRREFTPITLEQARPELQELVFRRKMEEEYRLWIDKIRETVYVERKGIYAEASRLGERAAAQ